MYGEHAAVLYCPASSEGRPARKGKRREGDVVPVETDEAGRCATARATSTCFADVPNDG